MSVVPDTVVVASVGEFYTFTRGYLVTGYSAIALPVSDQAFTSFTANGYAFDVVGAQVVAVNKSGLSTFPYGTVQYEIVRTGSFKQIAIYPVGTGSAANLVPKFDPAQGTVIAGPASSSAPSTTLSSWNRQGITFIPPANAAFVAPWLGVANLLTNGDFAGSNPYRGSGAEIAGWSAGANISSMPIVPAPLSLGAGVSAINVIPSSTTSDSYVISDPFAVNGNTSYFFSADAYTPNSTNRCTIVVDFYSDAAATSLISQVTSASFPSATGAWAVGTTTVTSPSNAVSARVEIHNKPSSGSGAWYVALVYAGLNITSSFNLYVDALNIQAVDAATVMSAGTAALAPWTSPRALQVNVISDPHTNYQDLTYRMSIMNRILQQSVPVGMRVLQPTFSS